MSFGDFYAGFNRRQQHSEKSRRRRNRRRLNNININININVGFVFADVIGIDVAANVRDERF
ncbi:MAG TPA: hypothetical protein VK400_20105 [Pyrinomonadaceae bacterium]|nr:hypothetical protein [Pyrinomonadaceae bacterium]